MHDPLGLNVLAEKMSDMGTHDHHFHGGVTVLLSRLLFLKYRVSDTRCMIYVIEQYYDSKIDNNQPLAQRL